MFACRIVNFDSFRFPQPNFSIRVPIWDIVESSNANNGILPTKLSRRFGLSAIYHEVLLLKSPAGLTNWKLEPESPVDTGKIGKARSSEISVSQLIPLDSWLNCVKRPAM